MRPVNILLKIFKKTEFSEHITKFFGTTFVSQFIDKYMYENRKKFFFIELLHLEIFQI